MIFDAAAIAETFGLSISDNIRSTAAGLRIQGIEAGLDRPHRLAQYLAQLAHESARWRYDREIWGPTEAQRRYDTRTDLGNTAAADGDGFLYRGRGPIQITGKANYSVFSKWARSIDVNAPDFVKDPDQVNTDPWEGLAPIWFWEANDLNKYADDGNTEMVTRRINGGLNGYADRLALYDQVALAFLGYPSIRAFQSAAAISVDGVSGPQTRAAMHKALTGLRVFTFGPGTVSSPPATRWKAEALARLEDADGGIAAARKIINEA